MSEQVAKDYIDAGFDPVPLEPGLKKILVTGWNDPSRHFTLAEFKPDSNMGVRLGVPGTAPHGKMLYDGDLDDINWPKIADLFLPSTGAMWGRPGKPNSHLAYVCANAIPAFKFNGLGGNDDTLAELRGMTADGKAQQTVVPTSIWSEKDDKNQLTGRTEQIEWAPGCSLAQAAHLPEGAMLFAGLRNGCIALLLARVFPGKGSRHESRLPLAGFLLRLPVLESEAHDIGTGVMRLIGGDEQDWHAQFGSTLFKKNAGKRFTAGTALAKLLVTNGPETVARIREWFTLADADEQSSARALASVVLKTYTSESRPTLYFQQGEFYRYDGAVFRDYEQQLLRREVYEQFPEAEKKQIDEVMDALRAFTALSRDCPSPSWLIPDQCDPTEVLACRNCLLHVPTRKTIRPTPSFFTFNQIDIDYDPTAPEPKEFFTFLASLFDEPDPEAIQLIQEVFGYALTPERRFEKIVLIVGPKRGGKGTLGKILKRLTGARNVCHPSLSTIGDTFGRQSLIGKTLAIIGDLRVGPRSDLARIAEVLLSISGTDDQTVHRKNKEDWHGRLFALFVILSNELPDLRDTSGALASRFVVLQLVKTWLNKEDKTLADRIMASDMPGILNWALEGRQRLYARGHFVQPASGEAAIRQLEELASPVGAFLREYCRMKVGASVSQEDLFAAWQRFCIRTGNKHTGRIQEFGRDLRAALPWITDFMPRGTDGKQHRSWKGLELRETIVKTVDLLLTMT